MKHNCDAHQDAVLLPAVCGHHTAQHKTPAVCGHHTAQHKTPVTEPTGSVNRDVIEASKRDVHMCKFFIIIIAPAQNRSCSPMKDAVGIQDTLVYALGNSGNHNTRNEWPADKLDELPLRRVEVEVEPERSDALCKTIHKTSCLKPSCKSRTICHLGIVLKPHRRSSFELKMSASDDAKIAMVRERWNAFAVRFTETANKRMTLQCAQQLHAHMQLDTAQQVVEVAAGAGLGSLDIAQRMAPADAGTSEKKTLLVTDLSPTMVELAKETLKNAGSEHLEVRVQEANGKREREREYLSTDCGIVVDIYHDVSPPPVGQDLNTIASGSTDRLIANMCLQLTPDADAMLRETKRVLKAGGLAGFTIWGRPEFSGLFTMAAAVSKELGIDDGAENPNFALGKDLDTLRQRFALAGFSQARIWPFMNILELWSGEEYAQFQEDINSIEDEELRKKYFDTAKRMGDEWLAKGFPIGQEAYIIIAKA
ncbi:Alanine--trna ligase, partial [Globisporangium splendens]